jgi:predicted Zn finger-like uncharacterized protein
MLFTRCPHCRTTFRITTEALEKAGGRVRCGRCAGIFDARQALHEGESETETQPVPPETAGTPRQPPPETADTGGTTADRAAAAEPQPAAHGAGTQAHQAPQAAPDTADAAAPARAQTAETTAAVRDDDAVSDTVVDSVLEDEQRAPDEPSPPLLWSEALEGVPSTRHSALWAGACVLASLVLLGQAVHHFRGQLAAQPIVGSWLTRAYEWAGIDLVPNWDVHQYRVLDWVATAEPKASGQGNLVISARIRNTGPASQPYPDIRLQLKNRWEDVVGSRTFEPAEYMARAPDGRMMAAGATEKAQLTVVDPGPDAYGFELDVCVEADGGRLHCAGDDVFKQP